MLIVLFQLDFPGKVSPGQFLLMNFYCSCCGICVTSTCLGTKNFNRVSEHHPEFWPMKPRKRVHATGLCKQNGIIFHLYLITTSPLLKHWISELWKKTANFIISLEYRQTVLISSCEQHFYLVCVVGHYSCF